MTSPVWFAVPPEVHSTLLSSGAGPGPLLAAAQAWRALGVHYADTAAELGSVLTAVQASSWEGPSASQFVAAHQPFLYWLIQANSVANTAATAHEMAAAGYADALTTMPTLPELAANHAVHGALLATNFFGINTIPIALNEADYVRMWTQAATTMSGYQAVAEASLASTPMTSPAPPIVTTLANPAADSSFPDVAKLIIQYLQSLLNTLNQLLSQYLPGPLSSVVSQMLDALVAFMSTQWFLIPAYSIIDPLIYFGPFTPVLGLFAPIGLIGLVGLAGVETVDNVAGPLAVTTTAPGQQLTPAVTGVTLAGVGGPAAAPAGAPASSAGTAAPATPATGGVQVFYAIGSDPGGEGFNPTFGARSLAALAAAASVPAAAALASSAEARAKRKARVRQRGHKYQFAYLDEDLAPPDDEPTPAHIAASATGAGPLGFAGTVAASVAMEALGLTHLESGEFADAPKEPMLPHTWTGNDDAAANT